MRSRFGCSSRPTKKRQLNALFPSLPNARVLRMVTVARIVQFCVCVLFDGIFMNGQLKKKMQFVRFDFDADRKTNIFLCALPSDFDLFSNIAELAADQPFQ